MTLAWPSSEDAPSAQTLSDHDDLVVIEGLSWTYRGNQEATLRDINLRVGPGEFLLITGPSGCGKSTLALTIGGYLFHQFDGQASGRVTVHSADVRAEPLYEVAEHVGLVCGLPRRVDRNADRRHCPDPELEDSGEGRPSA